MHLSRFNFSLILVTAALGILSPYFFQESFGQGQIMQDTSCPSCTVIMPEEIELYKDLFPLILWTDTITYDHESIITVNGFLRPENAFNPVTITVTNPIGNLVTVEQLTPSSNGDFSIDFNTASKLWQKDGPYIIKAQSGSETRVFKISVDVISEGKQTSGCTSDEFLASGHCIPYEISWAKITSANLDPQEKSLTVNIETMNSGELVLNPSNDVLRGVFMILVDGEESNNFSIDGNTITIPFQNGAEKIEILATFVIPEFGSITLMILFLGIAFILIWNRKYLRITPPSFIKI